MEIEFALELVEDLIAGVDMKIFATVGTAGNESDEVRILPDDSALAPVAAVLIDPLLKIETLEVREHSTSMLGASVAMSHHRDVIPSVNARDLRQISPFGRNDTAGRQSRYLRYFDLASCSGV